MTSSKEPFGIYIHVPFCLSKCPYCDFYSVINTEKLPAFVSAVKNELKTLERCGGFVSEDIYLREVSSVYFGGGTPSLLPLTDIAGILDTVKEKFILSENAEITLECNPGLKNKDEYFSGIKKAGVNRLSIGLQSALENERKALGRLSGAADVKASVTAAKNAGIDDISVDIMLGVPFQTKETLRESLDFALSLDITHLSVYILKLEEGTVFYRRRSSLRLPDEDEVSDMYLFTCSYLKSKGMRHYEVSNFCFSDRTGRHNMNYWRCGEYLGVGPSAHSFIDGRRFFSERGLKGFTDGKKCVFDSPGGDEEEKIMLALRTDEGVLFPDKGEKLKKKAAFLEGCGLVSFKNGRIVLTDRGFLLSNYVISEVLSVI